MANPEKTIEVPTAQPQKETMLDKTTRVVRQINDEDAHKRYEKSAKLREARFEKEADQPVEAIRSKSGRARSRRWPNKKAHHRWFHDLTRIVVCRIALRAAARRTFGVVSSFPANLSKQHCPTWCLPKGASA
jgi:hypothetical protein